ncbi:MAG: hypothetical protein GXP10_08805 [Gammaproteobacteria bacterium]|nr:hypothetical protein [Gammaproteobacteria bacterium]
MKSRNRLSTSKLLDRKAEQLAQRHRQRLNEMTETALAKSASRRSIWLSPQPALAFTILGIAVLAFWLIPGSETDISAPQMAAIPDWVLDEQVPLALLESPEFYRWLTEQMATDEFQKG